MCIILCNNKYINYKRPLPIIQTIFIHYLFLWRNLWTWPGVGAGRGGPGNGGLAARPAFLYILSFSFSPRDGSGGATWRCRGTGAWWRGFKPLLAFRQLEFSRKIESGGHGCNKNDLGKVLALVLYLVFFIFEVERSYQLIINGHEAESFRTTSSSGKKWENVFAIIFYFCTLLGFRWKYEINRTKHL